MAEIWPSQPLISAAITASANASASNAARGPRTTSRTATAASNGVITPAISTRPSAIEGIASGRNVPATIDPGRSAAQAGDRNVLKGSSASALGSATSAPSSVASAITAV